MDSLCFLKLFRFHIFYLIYQQLIHNLGNRMAEDGEDHHHRFSFSEKREMVVHVRKAEFALKAA